MRKARWGLLAVALMLPTVAAARRHHREESPVKLGLGADWWMNNTAEFNLTLTLFGRLSRHVRIGGRFGALLTTTPNDFGIPLDFDLHLTFPRSRLYIDGLVGPWILPGQDQPIRVHAAFGFGVLASGISFGLEVGWLNPNAILGLRVAFAL